jgi:hypothetical protein
MKTPSWKSKRERSGPPLIIRCECGEIMTKLPCDVYLSRAKGSEDASILSCDACGNQAIASIKGSR